MLNDFSQVIPKLHDVVVGWGWMAWPPSAMLEGILRLFQEIY